VAAGRPRCLGILIKNGRITGLDDIKYERTIEVVPSITVSQTGLRKPTLPNSAYLPFGRYDPIFNPIGLQDPGKFTNDPVRQDIGVNLKYNMSPNVTFDAAINPDYAEIEADAPVVAANVRFPIFFQEKRPFFLEGKDIFESSLQPFYSRTIVDPDVALKLSGKAGKNTFGVLVASDNAQEISLKTNAVSCSFASKAGPTTFCTAARRGPVRRSRSLSIKTPWSVFCVSNATLARKTTLAFSRRRGRSPKTVIFLAGLMANSNSIPRRQ
jgi:hypothetical protein